MKSFLTSILFLFFVFPAAYAAVVLDADSNEISDGDFESGDLSGWEEAGGNLENVELGIEFHPAASDGTHGDGALKIFGPFNGTTFGQSLLLLEGIEVAEGDQIEASIEMYTAAADQISGDNVAFLRIAFFDEDDNEVGGVSSTSFTSATGTDEWLSYTATGVAPANAVSVKYCLFFQQFDDAIGSVFMDNACLYIAEEVEEVEEEIPTMGQWGLVILALIMTSLGLVYVKRSQLA